MAIRLAQHAGRILISRETTSWLHFGLLSTIVLQGEPLQNLEIMQEICVFPISCYLTVCVWSLSEYTDYPKQSTCYFKVIGLGPPNLEQVGK